MEYEMFSGLEIKSGITGQWVYQQNGLDYNFAFFPDAFMTTCCDSKMESGNVEYSVFNKLTDICRHAGLSVDCCMLNNDWSK